MGWMHRGLLMGSRVSHNGNLTEADIATRLVRSLGRPHASKARYQLPAGYHTESARPAAVLIPFLYHENAWHILYTRRVETLPEHSGQVAFPGGQADPADSSPEETALREAEEEIGLKSVDVHLLGRLDSLHTISNYDIIPVIGRMPWPYPLHLAQAEVSRAFTIPLSWLADPDHFEIHPRNLPAPFPPVQVIYFQRYDGELLWGISAQITLILLESLDLLEL